MKKPTVEIYTTATCVYCQQAKHLLARKGIEYTEIRIDLDPNKKNEMVERSGRKTVPEVFIDGELIGGFDDLWNYDQSGRLDARMRR
ncbi:MAG: glutaredoxin 3 [Proteobacteria bacterium]|nr:glutaredoxin 3 [Pseudomonadota bacterium]